MEYVIVNIPYGSVSVCDIELSFNSHEYHPKRTKLKGYQKNKRK